MWAASLAGAAQCLKCHMVRGVGGQVGPDLSMIGKKASQENLFESILAPVEGDRRPVRPALGDDDRRRLTVTGLLVAETPTSDHAPRRQRQGHTYRRRRTSTGEARKLKMSIMPEDIVAALTEDELVDLVAYLRNAARRAALTPDAFHVVGPFPAEGMDEALDTDYGPEKAAFDPKAKFTREGRSRSAGRRSAPTAKGYFDLAALHGNGGEQLGVVHVRRDRVAGGSGRRGAARRDDGAKLWVNGKEVFTTAKTQAAAPGAAQGRGEAEEGGEHGAAEGRQRQQPARVLLHADLGRGDEGRGAQALRRTARRKRAESLQAPRF